MAAGLVAANLVPVEECAFTSTKLEIKLDGKVVDLALVDVAVCEDLFVGSKAVWDMRKVSQIFLNRAEPGNIGLSSIGGHLHPVRAEEPQCLCLKLGGKGRFVKAAVAPGIVEKIFICEQRVMNAGEEVEIATVPSVLALDGEREVEVRRGQHALICLAKEGPLVVDVRRTMDSAMKRKILAPVLDGEVADSI
jgi:hypothetical protein